MPRRLLPALLLAAITLPILTPAPAAAQGPARDYLIDQKRFRNACPSGLKFAAGACVRQCPAGFEDNGRTCRQKQQNRF